MNNKFLASTFPSKSRSTSTPRSKLNDNSLEFFSPVLQLIKLALSEKLLSTVDVLLHSKNYLTLPIQELLIGDFQLWLMFRGGSRTAAISKMEHFVITINGWKRLTIITKRSILDVAAVLDPLLMLASLHHLY